MEKQTIKIKLKDIVSNDNRKYTKDDGFEQLKSSIKQIGIIEQPVVREMVDGGYKIVAGRRRIAAMRELKIAETDCTVYAADDPASDDEIAAAENINRLEMHPLDEAVLFSSMNKKGMPVEEIAKYYARSPSAIYKRLRLSPLTEELKGMFRDGRLNIAGAAVLAELPEDDQKEFFKMHNPDDFEEDEEDDEELEIMAIDMSIIRQFLYKRQKNTIESIMKGCEGCAKRTHNEDNTLFQEVEHLADVCLDGDCYRGTWYEMIRKEIEAVAIQMNEAGISTDNKIIFKGGTAEEIYKKANKVKFVIQNKMTDFEVLREKDFEFTGETNRKKDACWMVKTGCYYPGRGIDGSFKIERVGYKARPPKEKHAEGAGAGKGTSKSELSSDDRKLLDAVANELKMPDIQNAEALKKAFDANSYYSFDDDVSEEVIERVIELKVENESGKGKPREYLEMFLDKIDDDVGYNFEHSLVPGSLDEQQKEWLLKMFNARSISEVSKKLPDDAQKLFHFLLLTHGFNNFDVVNLNELKNKEKLQGNIFWRYVNMSVEEYEALYLGAAKTVAAKALEPKKKKYLPGHNPESAKGQRKKSSGGKTAPEVSKELKDKFEPEEPEDDEDNYPFEPDDEDPDIEIEDSDE